MSSVAKYHYSIHFPKDIEHLLSEFLQDLNSLALSYHATNQCISDRRGVIPFPSLLDLFGDNDNTIIEVCMFSNKRSIQKLVVRVKTLSEKYDYSYVVSYDGCIVSAWCNDKTDEHRLNKSTYCCPGTIHVETSNTN